MLEIHKAVEAARENATRNARIQRAEVQSQLALGRAKVALDRSLTEAERKKLVEDCSNRSAEVQTLEVEKWLDSRRDQPSQEG